MKKIEITITNDSEIIFAEKSGDQNMYATKHYIPGSAIRGALVAKYLEKNSDETDEFYDLFLSGKVRFLPAYPCFESQKNDTVVLPLSLMKNKKGTEIKDMATDKITGAGFKKLTGFASVDESGNVEPIEVVTQISFHMSRNEDDERSAGKSNDGSIFNYEYIQPNQCFKTTLIFDDELEEKIKIFQKVRSLRLGRSRNSQYGKCKCDSSEILPLSMSGDIPEKIMLIATTPYIPAGPWQTTDEAINSLVNEINEVLGENKVKYAFEPENIFANCEEINGYVGVWHAKKPTFKAMAAGSIFPIDISALRTLEEKQLLQNILYAGLGENTEDGFGQFKVWNFAGKLQFKDHDKNIKNEKNKFELKKGKELIADILKEYYLAEVVKLAVSLELRYSEDYKYKHAIRSVIDLMESEKAMGDIIKDIENFKDTAKDNLKNIFIVKDNSNLYVALTSDSQPYGRLDFDELYKSKIESLGLTKDVYDKDEDYKTFWLRALRHCLKNTAGDENE
ncbi:MAG: hypothetical protein Q4D21_03055 [Phascolarctobacterium sp.]|nr:hypothetical protein [Phascolarctobacterium sp.]